MPSLQAAGEGISSNEMMAAREEEVLWHGGGRCFAWQHPYSGAPCLGCLCAPKGPGRPADTGGDLMVLLSPSPSLGRAPAAGNPALDLPEPMQAALGQPDHQLHALCRRGRRFLLPGEEPRSRCTAGRVEEEDTGVYGARDLSYSTWPCPGDQVAGVAGTSLEHMLGPLSRRCLLRRVTLADPWYTRTGTSGP